MRIVFAIIASLAWGLQYVLLERLLIKVPSTVFFALTSTAAFVFRWLIVLLQKTSLNMKQYFRDSHTMRLMLIVVTLFVLGNVVMVFAIKGKNATVASLIEISYPLFVVLFGYLIYRNTHLNTGTIIWWLLVLWGIIMVYIFNK
jgi:drug/metabolite transporter (DMT)-like permease